MKVFTKFFFIISLLIPLNLYAAMPFVFSDVSAGVFRFQMSLAEQGNPEAQYQVGEMYEKGKGVPKDLKKLSPGLKKPLLKITGKRYIKYFIMKFKPMD